MAAELPVVEELTLLGSPEARHPKQALRKVRKEAVGAAKEHDRCAQHCVLLDEPQAAQDRVHLPCARILDASDADRLLQGPPDLLVVEIRHGPAGRRLVLPPSLRMHPFQEHPVVLVTRHRLVRRADPSPGLTALAVTRRHAHHHHLAPACLSGRQATDLDAVDGRKHRRLDLAQLLRDFFHRMVAHLLADDPTVGLDAEEHPTAAMVEHRAQRARGLATLSGRPLELERLRLASGGPSGDVVAGDHCGQIGRASCRERV